MVSFSIFACFSMADANEGDSLMFASCFVHEYVFL
jgi:hypothetical protein